MPKKKRTAIRRSKLEDNVESQLKRLGTKYYYEPDWGKLAYTIPASKHTYTPDFYITSKSGKTIIIEAKGIWDYDDRYKHALIRAQHPDLDIRFVFTNPKQKIRKGSKTTYADICEGKGRGIFKGLEWKYSAAKIPKEWLEE